jgi:type II secretory pathway pseudopilin PulG
MTHRAFRKIPFAFTIIELMVVVVLMALLATAAVLAFGRPLAAARWDDAVMQLRTCDASARTVAQRFARDVRIVIDLDERTLRRREGRDVVWRVPLPPRFRVEQVRLSDGTQTSSGVVEIPISTLGISQTYAVRLIGPEPGQDRWLNFAGMTGQVTLADDESTVESIFGRTSASTAHP